MTDKTKAALKIVEMLLENEPPVAAPQAQTPGGPPNPDGPYECIVCHRIRQPDGSFKEMAISEHPSSTICPDCKPGMMQRVRAGAASFRAGRNRAMEALMGEDGPQPDDAQRYQELAAQIKACTARGDWNGAMTLQREIEQIKNRSAKPGFIPQGAQPAAPAAG